MEAITKKCTKCGEVKSLSAFYKRKNIKSGVGAECKACRKAYCKAYYEANKYKVKAYRESNKDNKKAYDKAYYEANKYKVKAYRESNKDNIKASNKAYKKVNKDNLTNQYVAHAMRLPIADIPPELIELKRAQLKLHRLIKKKQ